MWTRSLMLKLSFTLSASLALSSLAGNTLADETYDGAELYALNCSNCHGIYGEGDGAVTPDLSVVLLDLRYLSSRNDSQFPSQFVNHIIDGREVRTAHGPSGMPVWGVEFSRSEGFGDEAQQRVAAKIDAISAFLESIQIVE